MHGSALEYERSLKFKVMVVLMLIIRTVYHLHQVIKNAAPSQKEGGG